MEPQVHGRQGQTGSRRGEVVRWEPARRLEELPALGHQRYSLPAAGRVSEATGTCACVGVHTCASAGVCV